MAAGKFVRHKKTGFEAFIPADQWDESYEAEYHVYDPEEVLKRELEKAAEASKRHDEAVERAAEKKAAPKLPTPPKE